MTEENGSPPRDDLVRAAFPAEFELRDTNEQGMPTMDVGFARYGEWTEIDSVFEGNFVESIAPGAFTKTVKENLNGVRVLFNHGSDPSIGNKVLGPIEKIVDGKRGPTGIVPLLDTSYNRDLLPGLRAGVYGASFRFRVMREEFNQDAQRSDYNPKGLPERTIQEAQLLEFGPVTFPAYAGATAGVRSLSHREIEELPPLAEVIENPEDSPAAEPEEAPAEEVEEPVEPDVEEASSVTGTDVQTRKDLTVTVSGFDSKEAAQAVRDELVKLGRKDTTTTIAPPHPEPKVPRRDTQPDASTTPNHKESAMDTGIDEMRARIKEIRTELNEIAAENQNNLLDPATQNRWDGLAEERKDLTKRIVAQEEREAYLASIADEEGRTETGYDKPNEFVNVTRPRKGPEDVYDLAGYHGRANSQEHLGRLYTEGAERALDSVDFSDPRADVDKAKTNLQRVLHRDTPDREIALRILNYGSPTYRSAFGKHLAGTPLNSEEQRALGIASQGGQLPVPIQIDPSVTLVSNGVINPLRMISRNVTMTGYEWRGVTTTGVTAAYGTEASAAVDGSPTLIQPTIDAEQAKVFVPFSYEVGQDWAGLESELGQAIADSKDVLEATAFLTGAGHASNLPKGVLRASGTVIGTALNTNAGTVFTVQNIYELETALPPRFRPNASWVFNKAVAQRIRQFDTAGGASLWTDFAGGPLQHGMPSRLVGYPAYELSTMSTAIPSGSGASWSLFGDFSQFVIADRIGMSIQLIPNLFNGNTAGGIAYPTGQRGLLAFWRNSSDVMSSNAFRVGTQS